MGLSRVSEKNFSLPNTKMPGIELGTFHMQNRCSTTELQTPQRARGKIQSVHSCTDALLIVSNLGVSAASAKPMQGLRAHSGDGQAKVRLQADILGAGWLAGGLCYTEKELDRFPNYCCLD